MCYSCWTDDFDSASIDTAKTRRCADLIKEVYEHSCVGGALHIAVDDWNLEDDHIKFCAEEIEKRAVAPIDPEDWFPYTKEQTDAERKCCAALLEMTIPERASSLAIYEKFIP